MPTPPPAARFDVELSHDDVELMSANGYLVLDRITTDDEIDWLNARYDEVLAVRDGSYVDFSGKGDGSTEQFLQPELVLPELMATNTYRNARAIADRLLPTPAVFSGGNLFNKPAGSDSPTLWHQDESFHEHLDRMLGHDHHTTNSLTVWLALTDVTIEAGALRFVPGSHLHGLLPYELVDDAEHEAFRARQVVGFDTSTAITCPIPAGAATVHLSQTVHGAGGNTTSGPRRAWTNSFFADPVPVHLTAGDRHRMAAAG